MRTIILCLIITCCVVTPLTACQTPAVKSAEGAGLSAAEACANQNVLGPVEGMAGSLLANVGAALIHGAGMTSTDDGYAQAKADIAALPSTVKSAAITCAIVTAMAAYQPLAGGTGFAGGDARLSAAYQIAQRISAERGVK